ncbi:MAG: hypothetical protein LBT45_00165 [Rickettsiales bacterium]|jgi:hypothetical protein|nr:hypothetical protein [Rickettsiales bacterium]
MKKTIKAAAALVAFTAPAFAANLENPLYVPKAGEVYSKTGVGLMYKKADGTNAMKAKDHDGATEFPIWRLSESIGYGITDRLSINGEFGYTHDGDIDRQGLNVGRVGLTYRVLQNANELVWDVYADANLGGVSEMKGALVPSKKPSIKPYSFNYDNYANGRWGFYAGTKIGKTWDKLSALAFVEINQTFGNDNNKIDLSKSAFATLAKSAALELKSTTEYNAGLKAFYEVGSGWSLGGGFTYKHHADNKIKKVASADVVTPGTEAAVITSLDGNLNALGFKNLNDGFDEYLLSVSVANQLSDNIQIALYGEYTFDTAHDGSQNGTDVKAELGVRLNARF